MFNLSFYTLSSEAIDVFIIERVIFYGYSPSQIIFEITEGVEINDIRSTNIIITKLKKLGFEFALDDFGAGFSSFFYLTELPIDYLKIDKKIITGLIDNPIDHYVVRSIVLLAKSMNIKIIAEGIDSKELLDIVSQYKIDFFQGFYFSKPIPVDSVIKNYQSDLEEITNYSST